MRLEKSPQYYVCRCESVFRGDYWEKMGKGMLEELKSHIEVVVLVVEYCPLCRSVPDFCIEHEQANGTL